MAFQPPIQNAETIMTARLRRQHLLNILAARIRALAGGIGPGIPGPGGVGPGVPPGFAPPGAPGFVGPGIPPPGFAPPGVNGGITALLGGIGPGPFPSPGIPGGGGVPPGFGGGGIGPGIPGGDGAAPGVPGLGGGLSSHVNQQTPEEIANYWRNAGFAGEGRLGGL